MSGIFGKGMAGSIDFEWTKEDEERRKKESEKLGEENRKFQDSCRGKTHDEILKLAMEKWR